jgi:hypothetical protein
MEQIFNELKQFGLKLINVEELKINHNYLVLGFDQIQTNDSSLIGFSENINKYLLSEKKKNSKKDTKTFKISKKNILIDIFSYAKYIGIYKGKINKYKINFHKKSFENKYNPYENYSESESDSESDTENIQIPQSKLEKKINKYEYECVQGDNVFTKNDELYILENIPSSLKLFEVDNSFNNQNFLNVILSVCSNMESERDKFIRVTCSNKNITIESSNGYIPSNYDKSLEYNKNKKYLLDDDFIFFK